jgi:hypothetical protein
MMVPSFVASATIAAGLRDPAVSSSNISSLSSTSSPIDTSASELQRAAHRADVAKSATLALLRAKSFLGERDLATSTSALVASSAGVSAATAVVSPISLEACPSPANPTSSFSSEAKGSNRGQSAPPSELPILAGDLNGGVAASLKTPREPRSAEDLIAISIAAREALRLSQQMTSERRSRDRSGSDAHSDANLPPHFASRPLSTAANPSQESQTSLPLAVANTSLTSNSTLLTSTTAPALNTSSLVSISTPVFEEAVISTTAAAVDAHDLSSLLPTVPGTAGAAVANSNVECDSLVSLTNSASTVDPTHNSGSFRSLVRTDSNSRRAESPRRIIALPAEASAAPMTTTVAIATDPGSFQESSFVALPGSPVRSKEREKIKEREKENASFKEAGSSPRSTSPRSRAGKRLRKKDSPVSPEQERWFPETTVGVLSPTTTQLDSIKLDPPPPSRPKSPTRLNHVPSSSSSRGKDRPSPRKVVSTSSSARPSHNMRSRSPKRLSVTPGKVSTPSKVKSQGLFSPTNSPAMAPGKSPVSRALSPLPIRGGNAAREREKERERATNVVASEFGAVTPSVNPGLPVPRRLDLDRLEDDTSGAQKIQTRDSHSSSSRILTLTGKQKKMNVSSSNTQAAALVKEEPKSAPKSKRGSLPGSESLLPTSPVDKPVKKRQPFRLYFEGALVDVCDKNNAWFAGSVVARRGRGPEKAVKIHYVGFDKRLDEWVLLSSDRLSAHGSNHWSSSLKPEPFSADVENLPSETPYPAFPLPREAFVRDGFARRFSADSIDSKSVASQGSLMANLVLGSDQENAMWAGRVYEGSPNGHSVAFEQNQTLDGQHNENNLKENITAPREDFLNFDLQRD